MSIHFYTMLKAWRRARHEYKRHGGEPRARQSAAESRTEGNNPIVYAAGIVCAGQISERTR